ncbi:hypothetical protein IFR05_007780 [Cadophora sp. M221]|nr:hypothetical protein IFR05_007780 [Cadophora sp. M221]
MAVRFKKNPPQTLNPGPEIPEGMYNRQVDNDRIWRPNPKRQKGAKYASNQNTSPLMTSLPSHVQSPSFPAPNPNQQPPTIVSSSTGGGNDANTENGNPTRATIIAQFHVPEEGISLGRGASADVHEVICRGVKIARKQIFCSRRMKIEDVKRELEILRRLDHKHVVTLLGSYTQSRVLGLLLFPAAACDLGVYLDELDEDLRSGNPDTVEAMSKTCERLGMPPNIYYAKERLNRVYGCLSNAVQYLHNNDVRHKDLKPRNILLDRNDGLFVTDFGLSRDTTDASTSVTNGIERGTYKYCAPEVARYEPRGRAADIYSLSCVFLEINTVYRQMSLVEFDTFRTKNEDRSFQNSPEKLKEWMVKLREVPSSLDLGIFDMMDLEGYLTVEDAESFFEICIPGEEVRRHLWKLADVDSDGRLTRDEFDVARHLIKLQYNSKGKHGLPDVLPLDWVPPSMRGHRRGVLQSVWA